jgi:hypothetical protein
LCQTLPKALEKSQKTKQLNSFFSREFKIELYLVDGQWNVLAKTSIGIYIKLIKWFENYLFERRQKLINKNSWSSFEPVSAGVPQGSVLDPSSGI